MGDRIELVPRVFRVISSFAVIDSYARKVFVVAVGFVLVALILLAGSLYMSAYYMEQQQQLTATGDIEGALEKTEAAARFNPFDSMPLTVRANLLQQQGQNEMAAEVFEDAIDRDRANYVNYVYLGNLQLNRLNNPEEAVRRYEQALEKVPRDTGLLFTLAQARTRVGDLEGAKRDYEKLVELDRIPPRGLYNLGKIYVRTGEPERGVETLRQARERASASLRGGDAARRQQREAFLRSVDLALVDALVVEGRYDEARAALQNSDSEQAPALLELLNTDPESYRETVLESGV